MTPATRARLLALVGVLRRTTNWTDVDDVADELAACLAAEGEEPPKPETTCESECNYYEAKCGARFCSFDAMATHEGVCSASAFMGDPKVPPVASPASPGGE